MTGRFLNQLLKIGASHALYREDGEWYHHLQSFPGVLFDNHGYIIFNTKEDYFAHPHLQRKNDLHVRNGISSLNGYVMFTPAEVLLINKSSFVFENTDEVSLRTWRSVEQLLRDQKLVSKLKKLYRNSCQICGARLELDERFFYSEVHHIKPLGRPFDGPDILENMISVCPNHHVMLDFRAMVLDLNKFVLLEHEIDSSFIDFHNALVKNR